MVGLRYPPLLKIRLREKVYSTEPWEFSYSKACPLCFPFCGSSSIPLSQAGWSAHANRCNVQHYPGWYSCGGPHTNHKSATSTCISFAYQSTSTLLVQICQARIEDSHKVRNPALRVPKHLTPLLNLRVRGANLLHPGEVTQR